MKQLLITIAAVVLVGCGESQQSAPAPEAKPVEPVAEVPAQPSPPPVEAKPDEPVAEASQPEPPKAKAPDISFNRAAEQGNIEAVKQHLAAGVDVKGISGWINLFSAAIEGHKEVAELLIEKGVDVNAKDSLSMTPLHMAAMGGHKEIAELFIAKGADVSAKDVDGETPLDFAASKPEIADLLRKHGGKTGEELKAERK